MNPDQVLTTSDAARGPVEDASSAIAHDVPDSGAGHENQAIRTEGLPTGTVAPPSQPVEQSPVPAQETAPINKDDQNRFEYWQSQYDRAQGENNALKQELQNAANYVQQIEHQQQPQAQPQPSNGQPVGAQNQPNPLQKPLRPQQPHTYNEVDAFNDPDSESFKYRQSLDSYRDNVSDL